VKGSSPDSDELRPTLPNRAVARVLREAPPHKDWQAFLAALDDAPERDLEVQLRRVEAALAFATPGSEFRAQSLLGLELSPLKVIEHYGRAAGERLVTRIGAIPGAAAARTALRLQAALEYDRMKERLDPPMERWLVGLLGVPDDKAAKVPSPLDLTLPREAEALREIIRLERPFVARRLGR